nr:phage tail tube protein [uncultured Cohaesibacter sp.]
MAVRRHKKLAALVAIEATYGVDAAPAAADAIIMSNVTFTPLEGDEVSRDLILPYLGNQGMVITGQYGRIECDVEIAGAGAAGTAPAYDALMRACGLAQTITADTSVEYSLVEDDQESVSIYFIQDKVQHVLLGARGSMSLSLEPKQIPHFRFTITGLLGTITDIGAMPAFSTAGWEKPLPVSKANTTMSLLGWSSVAENLSIDLGWTVKPRFLIGDELVLLSDRSSTGTAVVVAKSIAEIDWFTAAKDRTRGALSLIHGTTAGNIVEITAPSVEIGKPTQGQTDGIVNYSLPLALCPNTGLDEVSILVR